MKRKILGLILGITAIVVLTMCNGKDVGENQLHTVPEIERLEIVTEEDRFEIIDCSDLTLEELENRDGKLIVERIVGEVLDEEGNGRVINAPDGEEFYIYYDVEKFKVGDIVVSYCIYNPDNNAPDDILKRFDYEL